MTANAGDVILGRPQLLNTHVGVCSPKLLGPLSEGGSISGSNKGWTASIKSRAGLLIEFNCNPNIEPSNTANGRLIV